MLQYNQQVKISIDFSKPIRSFPILGIVILIVGLCFLIYVIWQNNEINQKLNSLNQELLQISDEKPKPKVIIEPELEKVTNQVKDQLLIAWPALFDVIEHHYNPALTFTAFNFDAKTREIRIAGNSDSIHMVIEFVENLKKEHIFERVDLLNHHLSKLDGQSVHSFEVYAKWQ